MELETTLEEGDRRATLRAVGELDIASIAVLLAAAQEALSARPVTMDLDLSRVVFIDVRGVKGLMTLQRRAAVRGTELRMDASPQVQRVLELMGLSDRFGPTLLDPES